MNPVFLHGGTFQMDPRKWAEEFLVNQDNRVVLQMQEKEQHWSAVNWWSQKLLCWIFLEVLVSDGIAGMTLPVPVVRVSTSEILMPLFLRTWQTWLVIHLKMFFFQEEFFLPPHLIPPSPQVAILEIRMQLCGKIREYMEKLARK